MSYVKRFLNYIDTIDKYSANTIKNYTVTYNQFSNYLNNKKTLIEVSSEDLEGFLRWLKNKNGGNLSKATINAKMGALHSLYEFLRKRGEVNQNPCNAIDRLSPPQREIVTLTSEEINELLGVAKHTRNPYRDQAIIATMFGAGTRISEVVYLDKNDIYDLPEGTKGNGKILHIRNAKGYKDRQVVIFGQFYKFIEQYLHHRYDDYEPLFISERGKRMHADSVRKMLYRLLDKSSIDRKITPHVLRKSYGSFLYNHDVDLKVISENMGHSSIRVTNRAYVHSSSKRRSENTLNAFSSMQTVFNNI